MKRIINLLLFFTLVGTTSLFVVIPALAFPQLPSSFYGTIKVNDQNIPEGTIIEASIGDRVYRTAFSGFYQGDSVYSLDVSGDDVDTPAIEGGQEGDTITFRIGGVTADQTGIWQSGTNVELNLTVQTDDPLSDPVLTQTPIPTQTPITVGVAASASPDSSVDPGSLSTNLVLMIAGAVVIAVLAGAAAWVYLRWK